jgi:hypothetical protein
MLNGFNGKKGNACFSIQDHGYGKGEYKKAQPIKLGFGKNYEILIN